MITVLIGLATFAAFLVLCHYLGVVAERYHSGLEIEPPESIITGALLLVVLGLALSISYGCGLLVRSFL